jgi:NADPH:quinone reductase
VRSSRQSEDVVVRVAEITGRRGVDLILDPIGGKDFGRNFAMLAPLGMVISYGRLDGPPDPEFSSAMRAASSKSPAVRFFTIHSFDDQPDVRAATMRTLLDHLAAGRISPLIYDRLPLAEAARAHELLIDGVPAATQFWILWHGRAGTLLTMEMTERVLADDHPREITLGAR